MQKTQFFFHNRRPTLKKRRELKSFIESLFKREKKRIGSIIYIFCSDSYILKINKEFLKHDFYTDIITFDLSSSPKEIVAEIYISVDRVRDNANSAGVKLNQELHRVIFHGALHLCGYRDKSKREKDLMTKLEEKYLKLYFN